MFNKTYKFRIYPDKDQKVLMNKTFGTVRKYWNDCVAAFNGYHKDYCPKPIYLTCKQFREKHEWSNEVSASAIQQTYRDFIQTKSQYFNKKRSVKLGRPRFKSKHVSKASYRLNNQRFKIFKSVIQLEKIGKVKCVFDREVEGKLISCTVSKNPSGQYFVSICTEQKIDEKPKTKEIIALDVGVSSFYTDSSGNKQENIKFLKKSQDKLARLQRFQSKKTKGSRRYKKSKLKIARLHQKIKNQRENFLHNLSTDLVSKYDKIIVEDLDVQKMLKTKALSKDISDVSWSKFFRILSYKCDWYGKKLIKVDRYFPSTKTCSCCGSIKEIKLSDRIYNCNKCGLSLDRDHNAAINLLNYKAVGV